MTLSNLKSEISNAAASGRWRRWWLGANRAGLRGGAVAVKAFFGAAGGSIISGDLGIQLPALTLRQAAFVFAFAFFHDFFGYLAEKPLPEHETT